MGTRRTRLYTLTERWRARHDAARVGRPRPPASADREAQATTAFPFRELSPEAYADRYGAEMAGFTYDDERYADAQLDAWIAELGRILRARGVIRGA
jgi:hypothetical protein